MADLYGLSAADRDVLMRMIARERANYSANVRSLAPVPRKKIEWKPSGNLAWVTLSAPLYPALNSGTPVNRVTGYLCEYNETNQRWQLINTSTASVTVEAPSYSIAAPAWAVVLCQKRGDVYEAVSGAPLEESHYAGFDGGASGHGWSSISSSYGLTDTTSTTYVEKSAWMAPATRTARYYNSGYRAHSIEFDAAATTPSVNGNFVCNHTGYYEIFLEMYGSANGDWTGASGDDPRFQTQTGTTSGPSAGAAHTHTYDYGKNYADAFEPILIKPRLYIAAGGGAYTLQSSTYGSQFMWDMISTTESAYTYTPWKYSGRAWANISEDDRIGIEFYTDNLRAATILVSDMRLSFRHADIYTRTNLTV